MILPPLKCSVTPEAYKKRRADGAMVKWLEAKNRSFWNSSWVSLSL